jgi:hypothetical protein
MDLPEDRAEGGVITLHSDLTSAQLASQLLPENFNPNGKQSRVDFVESWIAAATADGPIGQGMSECAPTAPQIG